MALSLPNHVFLLAHSSALGSGSGSSCGVCCGNLPPSESCTGGLVASEIVKNSGVSSIFAGSVVTYSNNMKVKLLGVKQSTLALYGAVSEQCVTQMLLVVLKKFDSDFAIEVSGIAGPTGGSEEKPVGTVLIGAKSRTNETKIKKLVLKGDRTYIRQQSLSWALKLLVDSHKDFFFKINVKTLDK